MTVAITLSLGAALLIACSVLLFVGETVLFWWMGLYDTIPGDFDLGVLMGLYGLLWALPCSTATAIWALFFRSVA